MALRTIDEIREAADDWHNPYTMYGPKPEGATTVNTDDNEKKLAQAAMHAVVYPIEETVKAADRFVRVMRTMWPPVNRVKGFDQNTIKAERRKAARAKRHKRRNPSHASQPKPPVAV